MLRILRFWNLRKSSSQIPSQYFQPGWVPEQIYERIFVNLSGNDIKQCRLVCKTFEKTASTFLDETTCIIFDGNEGFARMGFSRRKAHRLIRYLAESEMKFSLWSTMRIRNVTETHVKTLLQDNVFRFANTMQNVTTVELIKCALTWTTLMKFLHLFKNLEKFVDVNNTYMAIQVPPIFCCQAYFDPEERTLVEVRDYRLHATKISFSFVEPTWDIILMMRVMEITCSNVEEFELCISSEKESFPFERAEFSNILGLYLLKSLSTLKAITFKWSAVNYHFMFEDFFRVLPVLMTSHREIFITHLVLDFDWIFLGHSGFEQDLIPFVKRLKHLKVFSLMKIILQAGLGHLIEDIRPPPQCQFSLGVLLSDHPNLDEAAINRELIKTDVFTSSITALRVAIDLPETSNAGQVIPLGGQQSCMYLGDDTCSSWGTMKFKNTTELMIKHIWNGASSSFVSYNIHGVVYSFPNLTELCIFDGPKFEYLGTFRIRRQWDYMSEAAIMDLDMQLILKNLTKLKIVRIRAYLEQLTDCGLTGLSDQKRDNYDAVISMGGFKSSKEEVLPYAVSNLKELEEFVLKGVGDGVTDVTAYFAFNGLQKLHTIAICGTTKLSKGAKDHLRQLVFSDDGAKTPRCEFT